MPSSKGYIIVYDPTIYPLRIRWTVAHEIAHILLGHLEGNAKCDIEAEANYFVRELLSPLIVLDEIDAKSIAKIASVCNISYEAAALSYRDFIRRDHYKSKHGDTEYDLRFLKQFEKFVRNYNSRYNTEFANELFPYAAGF